MQAVDPLVRNEDARTFACFCDIGGLDHVGPGMALLDQALACRTNGKLGRLFVSQLPPFCKRGCAGV
jgi:hypothetical protein